MVFGSISVSLPFFGFLLVSFAGPGIALFIIL
ncbi:hypothetical protein EUBVEN_00470 [Eubacterium ventriosum ATCC 27560]|uniref:Uncharacterized protein n=1 Tax=Eubacterium ventriosum ATCC 27560 TaxID=411463 RepID=A5Z465_9FIRM|nr:hypothetical protein EUBVEN_00470 [Eubacterium ventriosum ATCC 27560]